MIDQNGYAETADREHLILRAKEKGITPYAATNAVWKAEFNTEIAINARFSAGELTYICTEKITQLTYRLCVSRPHRGNVKQDDLTPIEYIDGYESGELKELLTPARGEEKTEDFRARYLSIVAAAQAFGGNGRSTKQSCTK